jgi:methylmalonyl-CoA mutase N-terminal domain/subunit
VLRLTTVAALIAALLTPAQSLAVSPETVALAGPTEGEDGAFLVEL